MPLPFFACGCSQTPDFNSSSACREHDAPRADVILGACRNMFGKPLAADCMTRLQAAIATPSQKTWEAAYSLCISKRTGRTTLWQSVLYVDPDFPREKRRQSWDRIPDRALILRAIAAAVREEPATCIAATRERLEAEGLSWAEASSRAFNNPDHVPTLACGCCAHCGCDRLH